MFSKRTKKKIENLELNVDQLKAMGGNYVLSTVPILNAADNRLAFHRAFESETSHWKIYLYEVV